MKNNSNTKAQLDKISKTQAKWQLPPKKIELSEQMKNWIRFTIVVYSMPFGGNLR